MGLATTEPPDPGLIAPAAARLARSMPMTTYLLIALGGAVGALLRYGVDTTVTRWTGAAFPFGTLVVNTSGSFVLGLLFALVVERSLLPPEVRPALMIGLLGAYTTFSTWMLESWRLVEDGAYLQAVANLGGSVLLGIAAVTAGLVIGRIAA
jgi:CrcB protein